MIIRVIIGLIVLMLAAMLAGCGGSSAPSQPPAATASPAAPTATPIVVEATVTPVPQPTDPLPNTTPTTTGGSGDQTELINQGKILFETTAGGVGCALCHGLDGMGKPELATPKNRGATAEMIWNAIDTRAQMTFLVLSNDEVRAIAAYLQELDSQP